MATLEKIRSKSVLLIIIIGVALLAFIIGDAITNSRNLFGDQSTVAKIGGRKIDYTDYIRKREELNSQLEAMRRQNPAQYSNYDVQALSQQAIEALINESLIDEAAAKAGLRSSSSQLKYYVIDNPVNPAIRDIMSALANSGHGVSTPAQAYDIIFNPQNYGLTQSDMDPLQRQWIKMEKETAQMVVRNSYQNLLMGTVKANDLDKKALYNDYISTKNVALAYVPYGQLDPEKYVADDALIRNEYEKVKGRYGVDELTKDVAFIAVSVNPSPADRQAASKLAAETASAMRTPGGIGKELRKDGILVSHKELLEKDLPRGAVKDFVTSAPADSVKIVTQSPKGFTIVKMGKHSNVTDSIKLNVVQVAGEMLAETVKTRLNGGLQVDSLSTVFSVDSVAGQSNQWIALYNNQGWTGALDHSQVDSLMNSNGKYISLLSTPNLVVLGQMVEKSSPKSLYEYDEVNYDLKPSLKTLNDEQAKLDEFLASNPTAKDFVENASKEGYRIQNLSLTSSSPAVPNMGNSFYPDSRQVVRWVMIDGKPGQVSHVYESNDALSPMLYAVAVVGEYDDYVPLTNNDVNSFVSNRVRSSLAGDEMIAQYQPKAQTMASASQAMNVESRNDSTFRFGRNPRVRDAAVIGKIAGSQPGNVVLVKGDNGVYAYQILSSGSEDFEYNDQQYARQYNQLVSPNFTEMLKGGHKVKNNIYKFEAGD